MSDTETATTAEATAAALIEQVWGSTATDETGPAVEAGTEAVPAVVVEPAKVEEAAKDPAAERVAARIIAAKRTEMRAAAARAEIQSQQAALAAEKAALAEQAKELESFKASKLSPSKMLEAAGYTPKAFLEALAGEHEPTAIAARASQGAMSEVEKIKAEFESFKKAAEAEKLALRQQQWQADYDAQTQVFLEKVEAAADKYPHLIAENTPSEIAHAAKRVVEQLGPAYFKQHGEHPDDDVVAEYLEDQARARAEALAERRARVGQKAPQPGQGTPLGLTAATPTDQGPGPRTLTSRDASIKASAPKPWSQEAADEESLRILRAAMRTG